MTARASRAGRRAVLALGCALVGALGASPAAQARIVEIGATDQTPAPSCPGDPCQAVSRTTGYQAAAGSAEDLFVAPQSGRVVAWSISLGDPSAEQRRYFEARLGGAASAGIAVLRPGPRLTGRLLARSPVERLTRHFGRTVQFPLVRSLSIRKGHVVALNVPTWAPALALGLGNDHSWRASRRNRPASRCLDTSRQTVHLRRGSLARFECRYPTARLTYSVTMVTRPR